MIWSAYVSSSNVFEDMPLPCILTIYSLIGLLLWYTSDQTIKEVLHVERSNLFMDAQIQLQPIQTGKYAVCKMLSASLCHHIKNGWRQEMAGLLWFAITTEDFVQTMTPNWLTTRDIWWLVSVELACWLDMTKTRLSWWHVVDMSPTLPTGWKWSNYSFPI